MDSMDSVFDSRNYQCQVCGYKWQSKRPVKPLACPNCRSTNWQIHEDDITLSYLSKEKDEGKIIKKFEEKTSQGAILIRQLHYLQLKKCLEGIQNALNKRDWKIMAEEISGLKEAIKHLEKEGLDLSKNVNSH